MASAYVIVGAGQAGGWAAKTLRDEEFDGRVIVVGEEPHPPHERPPLSKGILLGEEERDSCLLWPPRELEDAGIELRLGERVAAIAPDRHALTLESGETLEWSKLLLATGGSARTLDVEGSDLDGVLTLRTIADCEELRPRLSAGTAVLVVGAGWIGLEVAAAARKKGAEVTVVEASDRVCARALTPGMSEWVLRLHENHGVDVRLGSSVARFEGDGRLRKAVLEDGGETPCDVCVVGVGMAPRTSLAEAAGLDVDDGIVTDECGRTSHPDVFAAGDVASHPNPILGRRLRLESWENAQNQAINTARTMLGKSSPYAEIPWFWSDQHDANIQLMGLPRNWTDVAVRGDRDEGAFVEFYLDDGRLQGAAAVNNARDLRFTRRLMMADRTYDPSALADPGVKLQSLLRS